MKNLYKFIFLFFSVFTFSQSYQIKLNLEKGKTYNLETDLFTQSKQKISGQNQAINFHVLTTMSFEVKDFKNSLYQLEGKHLYYKTEVLNGPNYINFDSDADDSPLSKGLKSIVDSPFTLFVDSKGEVKEIKNYDLLLGKIVQFFPDAQKQLMKEQLKASFSDETLRASFALLSNFIINKDVKINETWQKVITMKNESVNSITYNYKLVKVDADYYYISATGNSKSDPSQEIEKMGYRFNTDMNYKITSNYIVDRKSGWIKDAHVKNEVSGTMKNIEQKLTIELQNLTTSEMSDNINLTESEKGRRLGVSPPPPMPSK